MKSTLTEMNTLQGINNEVNEAEYQHRDLEGKKAENTQSEQEKEKII